MYESPIKIIQTAMEQKMEDEIFKAIQHYKIQVDKDELIKALQYDRNQYAKGFEDGRNSRPDGMWIDTGYKDEWYVESYKCSVCGKISIWGNYCPNCGARMVKNAYFMERERNETNNTGSN